ncbi:hypothetical protein BKA82DRAFT_24251 [Pisolithus tinctorius]|nr:hypothetical protein BKA82DRAFT_24251 [Pisolithus tinctorius]
MSFTNAIFPSMPPVMLSDSSTGLSDFTSRWANAIEHARTHALTTPPVDSDEYDLKHWLEWWTGAWANVDSLAQEASSGQLEIPSTDETVTKLLREAQQDAKSISDEIAHHLEAAKSKEPKQVNNVSMGDSTAGGKNKSKEIFDGVEILTTNWSLPLPPKAFPTHDSSQDASCVSARLTTLSGKHYFFMWLMALATLEALKKCQKAAANDPDAESQASLAWGTKHHPVLPALNIPPPSPSISSTSPTFSTVPDPSTPSQVSSVPLHHLPHLAHPLASSFDISHCLEAAEESNLHNLRSLATLQAAITSNAEEIAMLHKIALGRKEY